MAKYIVEVEIPDGDICDNCQLYDGEYDFCHLLPSDELKYKPNDIYKLKHPKCPSLQQQPSDKKSGKLSPWRK